jgi:hypothetical protein
MASASSEDVRKEVRFKYWWAMAGMVSPRFAVYRSVPGVGDRDRGEDGCGEEMSVRFTVEGTVALMERNCAA